MKINYAKLIKAARKAGACGVVDKLERLVAEGQIEQANSLIVEYKVWMKVKGVHKALPKKLREFIESHNIDLIDNLRGERTFRVLMGSPTASFGIGMSKSDGTRGSVVSQINMPRNGKLYLLDVWGNTVGYNGYALIKHKPLSGEEMELLGRINVTFEEVATVESALKVFEKKLKEMKLW